MVSGWSSLMVKGDPAGNSTSSPLVPPAALPPPIPAVLFRDPDATLVRAADSGAPKPAGVTTLSNERLKDPALPPGPFFAGIAALTRPRTVLPAGIATRSPPTTASVIVAVRLSPAWLEDEPTGLSSARRTSVPEGTVAWTFRGIRGTGASWRG